jgi:hypothetical protein
MKKLFILLLATTTCCTLLAQKEKEKDNDEPAPAKNAVKLNLFALALKNITIQYERAVGKKVTIAGTFRYMPTSFKALADDPDTEKQIDDLKVGNFAFMPEARMYFSKKGAFHGFYLGLYANIARYNANIPFKYDDAGVTKTIQMSGHLTGITGGLMIGAQFKLGGPVYLDWWALGPGYGTSNGKLTGNKTMNATEQQDLRDELAGTDIPLTKFTYTVNGSGATIDFKGPWAGIRSGLCIGVRF